MGFHIRGRVLPRGERVDVYVEDGRFVSEPDGEVETVLEDAWLLPGLVDVHAHLALASPAGDDAAVAARVRASGRAHLESGVLAVREPGSLDHSSTGLGPADGMPRVHAAGRFLAPPGRYFPGLAREVHDDQLPDAAVEELNAGGGHWAKIIGDSPVGQPHLAATFSTSALAEAAVRVHAAGGRIAVHCSVPEVIQDAIDTGFDSLEHASLLRPDQVDALAAAGAAWVPTRIINSGIRHLIRDLGYPETVVREIERGLDRQPEVLCAAAEAGVPLLAGTDAGMGPHGMIRTEIQLLLAAGLSPDVALGAASWSARTWLGLPGIEHGAPADLVAYRTDPREDVSALGSPSLVILAGALLIDAR